MAEKPAMLFVDAQNLWFGANQFDESFQYDPVKLKNVLAEGYDLIRAYWFDSYPDGRSEKDRFFYFLETNGYRVDARPLRKRGEKHVEKGADVGLVTELIALGFNDGYDVAIVVTDDSDFSRAIRYVQDCGKYVIVASFEDVLSSNLKRVTDEYVVLDEVASEFERSDN